MTEPVDTYCRDCKQTHPMPGDHATPGLAVVHLTNYPCDGANREHWSVTHVPSGLALAYTCCADYAWAVADAVADTADWTQPEEVLLRDHDRLRAAVQSAVPDVNVVNECLTCAAFQADAAAMDRTPERCWRCDAAYSSSDVGLCDPCHAGLVGAEGGQG